MDTKKGKVDNSNDQNVSAEITNDFNDIYVSKFYVGRIELICSRRVFISYVGM